MIRIQRIYEKSSASDGFRVLVDRLWPRGVSKKKARLGLWLKSAAPSTGLRNWFGHDPRKWQQFKRRYATELRKNPAVDILKNLAKRRKTVTLLYGAKDQARNEAVVLRDFTSRRMKK